MKISVVGAGSWGTAFARMAALSGHHTVLWARRKKQVKSIRNENQNSEYLPGFTLPKKNLKLTNNLENTVAHARGLFMAVPSFAMRSMAKKVSRKLSVREVNVVSLAKGLEKDTFKTMSTVLSEELAVERIFALSGPSHAEEVALGYPTAVVLAGDLTLGRVLQKELTTSHFRVYLKRDIKGVEYCGAMKNIIAIATGLVQGLGFGDNAVGALIARGLAEMIRFGEVLNLQKETFFGLAGVGDLVATCTSEHSRNRSFGYRIGQGESIQAISDDMNMIAEGRRATKVFSALGRKKDIDLPITESLYRVLYEGSEPIDEVEKLMARETKVENI